MKKIFIIIVVGLLLNSCASSHDKCDAYSKVEKKSQNS